MLKIKKLFTSAYGPGTNGGTELHTEAMMMAVVVNERQNDLDVRLPHVEFINNTSVNQATGLASNEVHISCRAFMPRFPLSIFDHSSMRGHQSLDRDQVASRHGPPAMGILKLVREFDALTRSRIERRNSRVPDVLHKLPQYHIGDWELESTIPPPPSAK